jgi:hypothetical protein
MKSLQPAGLASLAKGKAFFALFLATMQPVPDHGSGKTKNVSDGACDRDGVTAAIGHRSVFGIRRIYARACQKTRAIGIQWVIDQRRV